MVLPWGGFSCCLSGSALYLLGRSSGRDAEALNSVPRVDQLKELAKLLDIKSEVRPLVVAISGGVRSETPIASKHSDLRGVIVEETSEKHYLKHNGAGSWIQGSTLIPSATKEVPWYLDDGTGRVYITGAQGASGFMLPIVSKMFEESGRSFMHGALDSLLDRKALGVMQIERVLPVDTSLTVVGEAVKDNTGKVRIMKPMRGPFYVSDKPLVEIIGNLGKWPRRYKYASMGLSAIGILLIAKHVIQYVMEKRYLQELQRRDFVAAARKRFGDLVAAARKRLGQDEEDRCVICPEHEFGAVFRPCRHMCCCTTCSPHITNCPLCRRRIERAVITLEDFPVPEA